MKTSLPNRTDVVIIGGGPVGLTASLLLDRLRIAHVVVEAQDPPSDHPQAHFINSRSMEIFRELGLEAAIREAAAPLDEWRRHVYATALAQARPAPSVRGSAPDTLLGVVDHFPSGPDHRISPSWESNLSQPRLQGLLREAVDRSRQARLLPGWRADLNERHHGVDIGLRPTAGGREHRLRCRYVVCAAVGAIGTDDIPAAQPVLAPASRWAQPNLDTMTAFIQIRMPSRQQAGPTALADSVTEQLL